MAKKKNERLCPFCSCSFSEKNLIVEIRAMYGFDKNGRITLDKKAFDKINCSNCLNDITTHFIGLLYEHDGDTDYEVGFKDGYNDAVDDANNNGDFADLPGRR
jgi:hypothetical protein